ncbi:MAG: hypothetical protein OEU68_13485 [Nitrospira sp.]|jgi:hypothetical protein|nr:hypothetical protein [Nitrospira sp.]MDH4244243.1 hypothetical protein [Nitrospira sp.]MDH4357386.1 hypothetical protein [Nitrospira sp.]MDH5319311.1 hypothetical protein [Nitrospira sp.]
MARINLDPLLTFSDGSHLVISTKCSTGGDFSCPLYNAIIEENDRAAFQVISTASTCLVAQGHAYSHALHLYPSAAGTIKKPPYLVWSGPRPTAP